MKTPLQSHDETLSCPLPPHFTTHPGNLLLSSLSPFEGDLELLIPGPSLCEARNDSEFEAHLARDVGFRLNRAQPFFLKVGGKPFQNPFRPWRFE